MDISYRDQIQMLSSVRIPEGTSRRIDCPFCGGKKTFTISNIEGSRVWNCYKLSCNASGKQGGRRSLSSVSRYLGSQGTSEASPGPSLRLPDTLSRVDHHPSVLEWLSEHHCIEAYRSKRADIRYDPMRDRVLFIEGDMGVGRTMKPLAKPKWLSYGDTSGGYCVGSGKTVVVVEDAASACAVSSVEGYVGFALLGTSLLPAHKNRLAVYDSAVLALDEDASIKALVMVRKMDGFIPTKLLLLEQDLKYLSAEEIRKLLEG